MRLMGACLLMLAAFMVTYSEKRRISALSRWLGSFAAAFRRLAREIVATGAPLARLMDRLSGDIAAFLVPGAALPEEMTEEQRASIEEVRRILGGYDAKTQQEALLRAAVFLEAERAELDKSSPDKIKVHQAITLSAAAVAIILLL